MLVGAQSAEAVVQHAVERRGAGVDPDILGGRVKDQRTQFADHRDRIHLLPEQVGCVEFDADVCCAGERDELAHVGG